MIRYVIHLVLAGGVVADDVYLGSFKSEERALERAAAIEKRYGMDVTALVRPLEPGGTSFREIERLTGLQPEVVRS